jgi:hypothetical protein
VKSMIELLETRQLFSAATAAVIAFRQDLNSLNAPLPVTLITYENAISKMSLNVTVFNTPAVDKPLLVQIRTDFTDDLRRLGADITVVKTLMNQDMVNLVQAEHLLARRPTNEGLINLVTQDAALLNSQAQADLGPIASDCAAVVNRFSSNAAELVDTHPIDASLGTIVNSMDSVLTTMSAGIQATNARILHVAVPNVIAALAASAPSNNSA